MTDLATAGPLVGVIDQGTSSTRFMAFDGKGTPVAMEQMPHSFVTPKPGWVEIDPQDILQNTYGCMQAMLAKGLRVDAVKAIGITNQRETTLLWSRRTGTPYYNAIVWNDVRTTHMADELKARHGGPNAFRAVTGLPISEYFSALKVRWLLENVPEAASGVASGDALFGTVDTYLAWHLSGRQLHITDVTNASRTLLMDLRTLDWDPRLLRILGIPRHILPEIRSCSEVYGKCCRDAPLPGVPLSGILGDQQAALFGQAALRKGQAKATFGTGAFIMLNTGPDIVPSWNGLLTTPAYKLGDAPCVYALEGACFSAGSIVNWVREKLKLVDDVSEMTAACEETEDNGGVYFVPAFSGLGSPHWEANARGTICGLTHFAGREHLLRATVEAVAFQVSDVLLAMQRDGGVGIRELKVDGGMTSNDFLMQFQANLMDATVVRAAVQETTALGAAYAAGLAIGFFKSPDQIRKNWRRDARYEPNCAAGERAALIGHWAEAVDRSKFWAGRREQRRGGNVNIAALVAVAAISATAALVISRWTR